MLEFDYRSYQGLLKRLSETHRNASFVEPPVAGSERAFILRHDIDLSLPAAVQMAELESSLGIHATYFLLLNGRFYNLLCPPNHDIPRRLSELGHEVGLHYDGAALGCRPHEVLRLHAGLLGSMSRAPVRVIARHNPSLQGSDPAEGLDGYINAYSRAFTEGMTYLSDSGGAWRDEATVLSDGPLPGHLYLLIHPIFWDEHAETRLARLQGLVDSEVAELHQRVSDVSALFSNHAGVIQHDKRIGAGAPAVWRAPD